MNINYTEISANTCKNLSNASQFFYSDPRTALIVQDAVGLDIETHLASVDLAESIAWILIIFAIEINVFKVFFIFSKFKVMASKQS